MHLRHDEELLIPAPYVCQGNTADILQQCRRLLVPLGVGGTALTAGSQGQGTSSSSSAADASPLDLVSSFGGLYRTLLFAASASASAGTSSSHWPCTASVDPPAALLHVACIE